MAQVIDHRQGAGLRVIPGWVSPSDGRRVGADVLALSDSLRPALFVTEFVLTGLPSGQGRPQSVVTGLTSTDNSAVIRLRTSAGDWILELGGLPGHAAVRSARTQGR